MIHQIRTAVNDYDGATKLTSFQVNRRLLIGAHSV